MKKTIVLVGFASVLMLSGCATMFGGGPTQKISIHSNQQVDAIVTYTNGTIINKVTAPATIEVARKDKGIIIRSVNDEFAPVTLESKTNVWAFANAVLGLWGLSSYTSTDRSNGSAWCYDEDVELDNMRSKENTIENHKKDEGSTTFKEIEE